MSRKLRRACSLSLIVAGAQALAFSALAQSPQGTEETRGTMDQSADVTSATTGAGTRGDRDRMDRHTSEHAAMKNVTPQSFAKQAAIIGQTEIELAQVALQNTKNEEIRLYAERMIKDHKAANEKLKKAAAQENISLPQTLDAEHRAKKQKLASLQGAAFDREYRKEMAKGHDKAVALFKSASQSKQMPEELREFAASTLDTLEDHREDAHDMREDAQEEGA